MEVAGVIRDAGIALSMNVVLHRANMGRLREIIGVAESLGATRLELANAQYYGWAFKNRAQLLPTRQQVDAAMQIALAEKKRLADKMEIFFRQGNLHRRIDLLARRQ